MAAPRARLHYRFWRLVCRILARVFLRLRIWGAERLPAEGGCILACNHQSYLDPPLAVCLLERESRFMASSSLFGFRPFAWLIGSLGSIPIERGESDRTALRRAEAHLRAGGLLTLFPEGTRSGDGYFTAVKAGVGSLAVRAGVPVVPAFVHGAFDVWPRTRKLPRPAPVGVFYGEPIYPPGGRTLIRRRRAKAVARELQAALEALEQRAFELMPLRTRSAPEARAEARGEAALGGDRPGERAGPREGNSFDGGGPGAGPAEVAPGAFSNGQS